jgi:5-methylcytosine-specific restriction endonuclease McrA
MPRVDEDKREHTRKQKADHYARNRDRIIAQRATRLEQHREEERARRAARYEDHREERIAWQREYYWKNTDEHNARSRKRYATKLGVPSDGYPISEIFDRDGWVCQLCLEPVDPTLRYPDTMRVSIDHIVPISKGGHDTRDNVQCSHLRCNISKGNRV